MMREDIYRGENDLLPNAGRSPSHRPLSTPSIDPPSPLTTAGNKRKRSGNEAPNPRAHPAPRLQPSASGYGTNFISRATQPLQSFVNSTRPTIYGTLQSAGYYRTGIVLNTPLSAINKFYPGLIIQFSHHATAQDRRGNPLVAPSFVQTTTAKVSSKFRYGIVLVVYDDGSILILPMFTHGGRGITGDRNKQFKFYMLVAEEQDLPEYNPTSHDVLKVRNTFKDSSTGRYYKISRDSSVCLSDSYTIKYNDCSRSTMN
ncbi:hypothetical protein M409DRAFT_61476 [Zasmidium cellare ATCC 36951]|uniref:Uncharacterized protein n=1 Tax=Zasmidium cellare ATCC 36951 TaxID=1080233 RepID=A0A6A6BYZ2_ZASCE|nr:uncharacterized protein M409DRAFT_61476 [Zasmidium cellare ATCC 36951]KAF2158636.1 hypothetical protein M409DRAFT_61476 [Zasmidium cellare ATCC 36951]